MTAAAPNDGPRLSTLRLLLTGGAIGPLLFIVVFLIEGATRPDYSVWRHYVSSLSRGERGWVQIANFVICGALIFGFAVALRETLSPGRGARWGPILLGGVGLGLIGAGIFVTDPLLNYPPGMPSTPTLSGSLHGLVSGVAFVSLIAACIVLARRVTAEPGGRGWAIYSLAAGILVLAFLVASAVAATDSNGPAGLWQRLSIITGWTWIAVLALRFLRQAPDRTTRNRVLP